MKKAPRHVRVSPSAPPRAATGQVILELLLILAAIIGGTALFAAGPFRDAISSLFGQSAQAVTYASARLQRGLEERAQEGLTSGQEEEEEEEAGSIVIAGLPSNPGSSGRPSWGSGSTGLGTGGGGGGGSIGGGGGGGGGSSPPSGSGGSGPANPGPILAPPSKPPSFDVSSPTAGEQQRIDAARALLLGSSATFTLFDFAQGQLVTRAVSAVVNGIEQNGVPMLVGNLAGTIGALAAVFFSQNADGTFNPLAPVRLVFDRLWLSRSTTEMIAAVLGHEGWHVNQLFNGIHDNFVNYPRVIDIEYEAFVVGAAVWDAHKGSQVERTLDLGSACVASGEARCKEILATDFRYPTGPRKS